MKAYRTALSVVLLSAAAGVAGATQVVTLDFDTYTETGGPTPEHTYTISERTEILGRIQAMFLSPPGDPTGGPLGIEFKIFDSAHPPVPFTTTLVKFNSGFMGGDSEKIDFRNLDDDDDVSVNALDLLKSYAGAAKAPHFGVGVWTEAELTSSPAIVRASANLAAHELGHVMGLRHHDSFAPVGSGKIGVAADKYLPIYPGPVFGTTAGLDAMGMSSSVALNVNSLLTDLSFTERSALKLTINAEEDKIGPNKFVTAEPGGDAADVGTGTATGISLIPLFIPNMRRPPIDLAPESVYPGSGGPPSFSASAVVVTGSIEPRDLLVAPVDTDLYAFDGVAGQQVTIEVISHIMRDDLGGRMTDWVNPVVELLTGPGAPIPFAPLPYGTGTSVNNNQFESVDSILFDVVLPESGTYLISVASSVPLPLDGLGATGDYELLIYSVNVVPEPATLGVLAPLALALCMRRSRR